jgi:hypothetical protein
LNGLFEPGVRHLLLTLGAAFDRIVNVDITPVVLGLVAASVSTVPTAR